MPAKKGLNSKLNQRSFEDTIKALSNEEIKKKREKLNNKLMVIYKLIQEGKFLEAEKEAKKIIRTKNVFKSNN